MQKINNKSYTSVHLFFALILVYVTTYSSVHQFIHSLGTEEHSHLGVLVDPKTNSADIKLRPEHLGRSAAMYHKYVERYAQANHKHIGSTESKAEQFCDLCLYLNQVIGLLPNLNWSENGNLIAQHHVRIYALVSNQIVWPYSSRGPPRFHIS